MFLEFLTLCVILMLGQVIASSNSLWLTTCASSVTSTNYPLNVPGEFEALGCKYKGFVTITISLLAPGQSTFLLLSAGLVAADPSYGIGVDGLPYNNANVGGSTHITVRDITFGLNAFFKFTGALPANSSLQLLNNSFTINEANTNAQPLWASYLMNIGIYLVPSPGSFKLNASKLIIAYNSLKATGPRFTFIYVQWQSLLLLHGSVVSISSNRVYDSRAIEDNLFCICWNLDPFLASALDFMIEVASHSRLAFDNNSISNAVAQSYVSAIYLRCFETNLYATINVSNWSTLSMSGNRIYDSNTVGDLKVIEWYFNRIDKLLLFSLSTNSSYILNDNSIYNTTVGSLSTSTIHAVGVAVWNFGTISVLRVLVAQRSSMSFDGNIIQNVTNSRKVTLAVGWLCPGTKLVAVSVSNYSLISFSNNSVLSSTMVDTDVASVQATGNITISVSEGSYFTLSKNTIDEVSSLATGSISVSSWKFFNTPEVIVSVADGSSVQFDGNRLLRVGGFLNAVHASIWRIGACDSLHLLITRNSSLTSSRNVLHQVSDALVARVVEWSYPQVRMFTIQVANASALQFDHNSGTMVNATYVGGILLENLGRVAFAIHHSSIVSHCHNVLRRVIAREVHTVRWGFSGNFALLLLPRHSLYSSIEVATNSLLAINNNCAIESTADDIRVISLHFQTDSFLLTHISISNGSNLNQTGNLVSNVTVQFVFAVIWDMANVSLTVSRSSFLTVASNCVSSASGSGSLGNAATFYWKQSAVSLAVFVLQHSSLMITNNTSNRPSNFGCVFVVFMWTSNVASFTVSNYSQLSASDNSLRDGIGASVSGNCARAVEWQFTSAVASIDIVNRSYLGFDRNSVSRTLSDDIAAVILWDQSSSTMLFLISSDSSISYSANALISTASNVSRVVFWLLAATTTTSRILVTRNSTMDFNGNVAWNASSTKDLFAIFLLSDGSSIFYVADDSAVSMSRNVVQAPTAGDTVGSVSLQWTKNGSAHFSTSRFLIESNVVNASSGSISVARLSLTNLVAFNQSQLSFTQNEMNVSASSMSLTAIFVSLDMLDISASSSLVQSIIMNAGQSGVASFGVRFVSRVIRCTGGSAMAISDSRVTGVSTFVLVNATHITISNHSAFAFSNNVVSDAFPNFLNISASVLDLTSSRIMVLQNTIQVADAIPGTMVAMHGLPNAQGGSVLQIGDNQIQAAFSASLVAQYTLLRIPALFANSSTFLQLCGNIVFGDTSSSYFPSRFLYPQSIAQLAIACSQSTSVSYFDTQSPSLSGTSTPQDSASDSHSRSSTATRSENSQSLSHTISMSVSQSLGSASGTHTGNSSMSASTQVSTSSTIEATVTCRGFTITDPSNTCVLLKPLRAGWAMPLAFSAGELFGTKDCTSISIPYDLWSGRKGSTHQVTFLSLDSRLPFHESEVLPPPAIEEGSTVSSVAQERLQLSLSGFLATLEDVTLATQRDLAASGPNSTLTATFLAATLTLKYDGRDTLSKEKYRLDLRGLTKCPIPTPTAFEVTLEASDRIFSVVATKVVRAVGSVVSAGGGLTLAPSAVARLSVSNALQKMSRCEVLDPDDSEESGFDSFKSGLPNPFGLTIGSDGARGHIRGALAMSAVYYCILAALTFAYTSFLQRLNDASSPSSTSQPRAPRYPSALSAAGSLAMDLAVPAGTILGVGGSGSIDSAVGWLSVCLFVIFVGHILFVTVLRVPKNLVAEPKRAVRSSGVLPWLISPTHKWCPDGKLGTAWLAQHEGYVADTRVTWYCGLEQGFAFVVTLLAALPVGGTLFCLTRGAVCVVLLGGQALVMVVLNPMVRRWQWMLQSGVLVLQTVAAVLSVTNALREEKQIEYGMDLVGSGTAALLATAFVLEVFMMLKDFRHTVRRAVASLARPDNKRRSGSPSRTIYDDPMLMDGLFIASIDAQGDLDLNIGGDNSSIDMREELQMALAPTPEAEVVQDILKQLREYELTLSNNL